MIAHLRGHILAKSPNAVILDCNGVGYELAISVATYTELPDPQPPTTDHRPPTTVALHVHTHVREDAIQLFGFHDLTEKRLFEKLLTISGIGPKLAITVLSGIAAPRLVTAIRAGDHATLTKIPGIGKKTAERVVLELKDKLDDLAGLLTGGNTPHPKPTDAPALTPTGEDVLSALTNLGYPRPTAQKALEAALKPNPTTQDFEQLFRSALSAIR